MSQFMAPKGILDMLAATPSQEPLGRGHSTGSPLYAVAITHVKTFQPQKKRGEGKKHGVTTVYKSHPVFRIGHGNNLSTTSPILSHLHINVLAF